MPISTNSIIHYTDTLEKIKLILKEGFKIKYCIEKLYTNANGGTWAAHPMVSFCDIPLSESYRHFDAYGCYGIGLTKIWAGKHKINPVLYIQPGSIIGDSLEQQFTEYSKNPKGFTEAQHEHLLQLKSITKNYSGELVRKQVNNPNYRFYDEREWRLIPDKYMGKISISVKGESYQADKEKFNESLNKYRIGFDPGDVSYLIVKNDAEIVDLIKYLREIYSNSCSSQQLDILFSKVCSVDQIKSDY